MIRKVDEELEFLQKIRREAELKIKNAPEGNLRCAINKGCYQYYLGEEYLTKDKSDYIQQIAEKDYCEKVQKIIKEYELVLTRIKKLYKEKPLELIYDKLHPARKSVVTPLIISKNDIVRQFEEIDYTGMAFNENDTTEYYTIKGERVRSKSEKIIADELYRYDIPYKYEMPIELVSWNKKMMIYPDFTALNKRTGKIWYIEHFGMMDDEKYYENTLYKLDTYEKNNILLGRDLLVFHETSTNPINTKVIEKYIKEYLL